MRKRREKDILAEAVEQLKKQGLAGPLPPDVLDATAQRIADAAARQPAIYNLQSAIRNRWGLRFAAAAAFVVAGYVAGRAAAPDANRLREALTPSIAASLEPVLRQKLGQELKDHYNGALAASYLGLKEELAQQYRDDMNRFAMQTLAASNAATNALLADLVRSIDTAQTQDRRRIALAMSEIEAKRIQDKTQLAAGIQTLAYRTEDEFSRTKKVLARFIVDGPAPQIELPEQSPTGTPDERSKP